MCRPRCMCNDTDATRDEIDQALEENFPGYLAGFNQPLIFDSPNQLKPKRKGGDHYGLHTRTILQR
jgi:hypothetical protein